LSCILTWICLLLIDSDKSINSLSHFPGYWRRVWCRMKNSPGSWKSGHAQNRRADFRAPGWGFRVRDELCRLGNRFHVVAQNLHSREIPESIGQSESIQMAPAASECGHLSQFTIRKTSNGDNVTLGLSNCLSMFSQHFRHDFACLNPQCRHRW
jgi:hypothetical protein